MDLANGHPLSWSNGIGLTLGAFDVPPGAALFVWNADRSRFLGSFTEANEKEWGYLPLGILDDDHVVWSTKSPWPFMGKAMCASRRSSTGTAVCCFILKLWLLQPTWGPSATVEPATSMSIVPPVRPGRPRKGRGPDHQRRVCRVHRSLVNNTAEDGTPYFLTANHCLGNPNSWVYYFNHESSTCGGNTGPTNQSVSGGTLLVNSGSSDVA